jgi:hypothetical protein
VIKIIAFPFVFTLTGLIDSSAQENSASGRFFAWLLGGFLSVQEISSVIM